MKRPLLLPLVPLYAAGVAWKSRGFRLHPERAARLHGAVVSVGSVSAGGAGKTPFAIALGRLLQQRGIAFDVLSRGHGRAGDAVLRVDPAGDAARFGDEPLLLAQQLGCSVYVASERLLAGQLAETEAPRLHLLDDGFQHRVLARDVDIALLTAADAHDTLLPAGDLREPLDALRRADIVAVRAEEAASLQPLLARVATPPCSVWQIERTFALAKGTLSGRPLAFCGIARPDGFLASLRAAGVEPAALLALRDHTRYDDAVIQRLLQRARATGADGFVCTAKDAVKLTDSMRRALCAVGPLAVADVQVTLRDADRCMRELLALLESRR